MLPPDGWARHESVKKGVWDKYFPKPVLITVDQFMEKDKAGKSRWYPLVTGSYIQGLVASGRDEQRVYVPDDILFQNHSGSLFRIICLIP